MKVIPAVMFGLSLVGWTAAAAQDPAQAPGPSGDAVVEKPANPPQADSVRPTAEAVDVDGQRFQAALKSAAADWMLTFDDGGTERRLPAAELMAWGSPREPVRGPLLILADGSLLVAEVLGIEADHLQVESACGGLFVRGSLPLERIAGIVLHPPSDPLRRDRLVDRLRPAVGRIDDLPLPAADRGRLPDQLADRADEQRPGDRLLLENGDELAGTISGLSGEAVQIEAGVGPVQVESPRVAAVAFNPDLLAAIEPQGFRALVGLNDGSLLVAAPLVIDGERARFTLAGGVELTVPAEAVVFLQPLGGAATYLSDLEIESYRHIPFLNLPWQYSIDANVLEGRLRAGGRPYVKGIGMHSTSRLTYRLNRPYRRFDAELAIDDATGGRGSVVFRVFVDSKERYRSQIIRGGSAPVPISLNVQGGRRLSLIVDFADRGDELDHANWLNARLVE